MADNEFREDVTNRGFGYLEFEDAYGKTCSIQVSSLVTPHLWLGINGKWTEDVSPRMHLSRKQVKRLIKYMKRWLKTELLLSDDPPEVTP